MTWTFGSALSLPSFENARNGANSERIASVHQDMSESDTLISESTNLEFKNCDISRLPPYILHLTGWQLREIEASFPLYYY